MSFRPTITVYVNGQIADFGYYRNWEAEDLFFEALAIALLYRNCRSISSYRRRKFGGQKIYYFIEPKVFENTEENLKELESYSEWPILVDLTAKCIYVSYNALTTQELSELPSIFHICRDSSRIEKAFREGHIMNLMDHCKIPYGKIDAGKILELFRQYGDLHRHLSGETQKKLLERDRLRLLYWTE